MFQSSINLICQTYETLFIRHWRPILVDSSAAHVALPRYVLFETHRSNSHHLHCRELFVCLPGNYIFITNRPNRGVWGAEPPGKRSPLSVHSLFTLCSLPVHCLFTTCSLPVHCLFTACSLPVHCLFTACSLPVHCLFTRCSRPKAPQGCAIPRSRYAAMTSS